MTLWKDANAGRLLSLNFIYLIQPGLRFPKASQAQVDCEEDHCQQCSLRSTSLACYFSERENKSHGFTLKEGTLLTLASKQPHSNHPEHQINHLATPKQPHSKALNCTQNTLVSDHITMIWKLPRTSQYHSWIASNYIATLNTNQNTSETA